MLSINKSHYYTVSIYIVHWLTYVLGRDRVGPERRSGSFSEALKAVPVLFYDVECYYLLLFNTFSEKFE